MPRAANVHYLGGKTYEQLPAYLSGWDVALMPFAMNESTQFISPTKTPEYLSGGKPVVSSPIRDVVRSYGHLQGVNIAHDADGFIRCCEKALEQSRDQDGDWLAEADLLLSATSWDTTQARMAGLIAPTVNSYERLKPASLSGYWRNWAIDHRGVTTRLSADGGRRARIEHRMGDGAANPYTLVAPVLQAARLGSTAPRSRSSTSEKCGSGPAPV